MRGGRPALRAVLRRHEPPAELALEEHRHDITLAQRHLVAGLGSEVTRDCVVLAGHCGRRHHAWTHARPRRFPTESRMLPLER